MLFAATAAACTASRQSAQPLPDARDRAAVALRAEQKTLALFSRGTRGTIDPAQENKIAGFAEAYRAEGRGPITITVPGAAGEKRARPPEGVIAALARNGVARSAIRVTSYPPQPDLEPSIQLAFSTIAARSNCTIPRPGAVELDPAAGMIGCAYTAAIARTVADPLDLAEPRRADHSAHRGPAQTRVILTREILPIAR
jgi:pilus biogenesis lipoprotein CpaD